MQLRAAWKRLRQKHKNNSMKKLTFLAIAIAMILEEKPMIASQAIPKPMDNAT